MKTRLWTETVAAATAAVVGLGLAHQIAQFGGWLVAMAIGAGTHLFLLVDAVLHSGVTLDFLIKRMSESKPRSVRARS